MSFSSKPFMSDRLWRPRLKVSQQVTFMPWLKVSLWRFDLDFINFCPPVSPVYSNRAVLYLLWTRNEATDDQWNYRVFWHRIDDKLQDVCGTLKSKQAFPITDNKYGHILLISFLSSHAENTARYFAHFCFIFYAN